MSYSSKIPSLYSTENIPVESKIVHEKWIHPLAPGFFWLIVEYDPEKQIAFGFACLNDSMNAEWGNIYIPELLECGAVLDKSFVPTQFKLVPLFS